MVTKTDVNLRRLLLRCEQTISDPNRLLKATERTKFVANVRYLEMLRDQAEKETQGLDRTAVNDYTHTIQRLSNLTEEFQPRAIVEPTLSDTHRAQEETEEWTILRREDQTKTQTRSQSPDMDGDGNERTLEEKRFELLSTTSDLSNLHHRTSSLYHNDDDDDATNLEGVLQHHRQQQEELTNDLVRMAERLKMNSVAFGDVLKNDDQVLRAAQDAISTNLTQLQKTNKRLGAHSSRATSTTIMTWLVVGLVCLLFVVAFLVIRLFPKAK